MSAGLKIYSHGATVCNNDTHENGDDGQVAITLPVMSRSIGRTVGDKDCYRNFSFALEYFHGHMLDSHRIAPTAERRLATSLTMAREARTMVAAATKRR